jgi:hypothetical protein
MTTRHAGAGSACVAALLAACSGSTPPDSHGVIRSITIAPQSGALCVGDSLTLRAQATDAAGQTVSGVALAWSSSAPEVIAVAASGVAHALRTGAAAVTASAQGVTSDRAAIDVPADLVPEFVPDSVILAPGDTMTLGVRLRRISSGPVPAKTPVFTPFDSAVAGLDASGLVRAKASGRAGFSVSACGHQGGGAVDVFSPPDAVTGKAYLWLSGAAELRVRLPVRALSYTRTNGLPAFQIFSSVGTPPNYSRVLFYVDTLKLTGTGTYALDSLLLSEAGSPTLACAPPRPSAFYLEANPLTLLVSLTAGAARVTSFAPGATFTAISGRLLMRMRGLVSGGLQVDTLNAIYTFSAPLVDSTGACP